MVRGRLARRAAAPRAGERGLVGGWGVVVADHPSGGGVRAAAAAAAAAAPPATRPDTLTLSAQAVLSERACAAAAGGAGRPAAAGVFCAAPPSPAGACVGDEGAPLAVFDANTTAGEPTFVGLFQAAAPPAAAACEPSSPAVYTRLSAHVAALAAAVAPYSLSFTG
ncbi:hypothetical protein I4F81_005194 [Pyropia yezoensis]|uniref:Uncharacterized protein n=1 Tax=Pyropia yezoensis TaxID=2788 RepID=A0ACC3BYR2_PYRYE|nr:hypothetical protein I4F81_005194 [Neopyropia yezoensis]